MTIAAGFHFDNGILLCADTELTGPGLTIQDTKISTSACSWGNLGITYCGNSAFAATATRRMETHLRAVEPGSIEKELHRVVDREYRRLVLTNPARVLEPSSWYRLLIAVSCRGECTLYCSYECGLYLVKGYEFIGAGADLAHYLIRPHVLYGMQESAVLSVAAFMLGGIKDYVDGCGGVSQFVILHKDGSTKQTFAMVRAGLPIQEREDWIESHARAYDKTARDLFFSLVDPAIMNVDFDQRADHFASELKQLRASLFKLPA
jgi:hypothetical protein